MLALSILILVLISFTIRKTVLNQKPVVQHHQELNIKPIRFLGIPVVIGLGIMLDIPFIITTYITCVYLILLIFSFVVHKETPMYKPEAPPKEIPDTWEPWKDDEVFVRSPFNELVEGRVKRESIMNEVNEILEKE